MKDKETLQRFGNIVRNYVNTSGDFRFIEANDIKFAYSSRRTIVCLVDTKNISVSIPNDEFDEWFENLARRIQDGYNCDVRRAGANIVFDVVPTDEFNQKGNDKYFLDDIGTYTAAILETIDGAVIDDWGDDGEDVDSPYYV